MTICNCKITIKGSHEIQMENSENYRKWVERVGKEKAARLFRNTRIPSYTTTRAARKWVQCREGHISALIQHVNEGCPKGMTHRDVIRAFARAAVNSKNSNFSSTMYRALRLASRRYAPDMQDWLLRQHAISEQRANGFLLWERKTSPTLAQSWAMLKKMEKSKAFSKISNWTTSPESYWRNRHKVNGTPSRALHYAIQYWGEGQKIPPSYKEARARFLVAEVHNS